MIWQILILPILWSLKIWNPLWALIVRCQTLITLKINPSNGQDYIDIWEACFYSNTASTLRGSDWFDAREASHYPGNVGSSAAAQHWHHTTRYMSARLCGCLAQQRHIDLGQKVVDWCLAVSRQCHSVCHTLKTQLGSHSRCWSSWKLSRLPSLNYGVPKKNPKRLNTNTTMSNKIQNFCTTI